MTSYCITEGCFIGQAMTCSENTDNSPYHHMIEHKTDSNGSALVHCEICILLCILCVYCAQCILHLYIVFNCHYITVMLVDNALKISTRVYGLVMIKWFDGSYLKTQLFVFAVYLLWLKNIFLKSNQTDTSDHAIFDHR